MDAPEQPVIGAHVNLAVSQQDEKQSRQSPMCLTTVSSVQSNLSAADANDACVRSDSNTDAGNDRQEFDPTIGAKPYSPFYRHATPTISLEQVALTAKRPSRDWQDMQRLESGLRTSLSHSVDVPNPERSKLWKERRPRNPLKSLSPKRRLAVKIVIAIFTVGTMIGIALGITVAVGGGVWRVGDQQGAIGTP